MSEDRRGAKPNPKTHAFVRKFLRLPVDASIFVENVKRKDVEYLRGPINRAGAKVQMFEVADDKVHHKPGVRMFRRAGTIDEDL